MSRLIGAGRGRERPSPEKGAVRADRGRGKQHQGVAGQSGELGTANATNLTRQYEPSAARPAETLGARSAECDVIVGTLITV